MPEFGVGEDAVLVESAAVDPRVLGVDVDQAVAEFEERRDRVDPAARSRCDGS